MTDEAAAEGPFTREDAVRALMEPAQTVEADAPQAAEAAPEEIEETEADTTAEADASEAAEPGADVEEAEPQEPETPAVDAPHWWTADQKARFSELPADVQQIIADTERNRDGAVGRLKQEAAEARKKADQEAAGLGQYRQAVEQVLESASQTFKSKWEGVDWATWAEQDPVSAFQGKAQYDKEQTELQQLQVARQASETLQHQRHLETETVKLAELAPDLAHPEQGSARRAEVGRFLLQTGIEQDQLRWISASEMALAYDAMRYRQLQAKAKSELAKPKNKPVAPAKPALKPAASQGGDSQQRDQQRLQNRFAQTKSREDAVALILAKGL